MKNNNITAIMKFFNIGNIFIGLVFIVVLTAAIYDTYYFIQGPINDRDYMKLIIGSITVATLGLLALGGWIYHMYKKLTNKKPA